MKEANGVTSFQASSRVVAERERERDSRGRGRIEQPDAKFCLDFVLDMDRAINVYHTSPGKSKVYFEDTILNILHGRKQKYHWPVMAKQIQTKFGVKPHQRRNVILLMVLCGMIFPTE